MRILVTGKYGQVVTALSHIGSEMGVEIITLGRPEIDLSKPESLQKPVSEAKPDVIISAAAYTAVDEAETKPDIARAINVDGPAELSRLADKLNIPILHLSTDYVFDGSKIGAYTEDDDVSPVNVYGRTKLEGERAVAAGCANHVILRTAWVYSPYGHNFVKTMLRLSEGRDELNVVADQWGHPTSALDIARTLVAIALEVTQNSSKGLRGVFNLTSPDKASWAEFAEAIFSERQKHTRRKVRVNNISSREYKTAAVRPQNSCLDGAKIYAAYGIVLPPWRESLVGVLNILDKDLREGAI